MVERREISTGMGVDIWGTHDRPYEMLRDRLLLVSSSPMSPPCSTRQTLAEWAPH